MYLPYCRRRPCLTSLPFGLSLFAWPAPFSCSLLERYSVPFPYALRPLCPLALSADFRLYASGTYLQRSLGHGHFPAPRFLFWPFLTLLLGCAPESQLCHTRFASQGGLGVRALLCLSAVFILNQHSHNLHTISLDVCLGVHFQLQLILASRRSFPLPILQSSTLSPSLRSSAAAPSVFSPPFTHVVGGPDARIRCRLTALAVCWG